MNYKKKNNAGSEAGTANKSFSIIGSNSYIARHISSFLKERKSRIYLYSNARTSIDQLEPYCPVDILDIHSLRKINFNVDFLIFCSGLTGTVSGFDDYESFIKLNEIGMLNLLTVLKEKKGRARIVFLSSRLVYKGKKNIPISEEGETDSKTIYAVNKLSCEKYLRIYSECFNIPYTIFRICIPYGNALDDSLSYGTLAHFISSAKKENLISIYGNGRQKRSFIHVQDAARIMVSALEHKNSINKIFNVGGPDILSIGEVAKAIASIYKVKVCFKKWPLILKAIESGDTIFDSSKIERLTGYKYQYNFETWLRELKR